MKVKSTIPIVLLVIFLVTKISYGEIEKTTVVLDPRPTAYSASPYITASDGNIYFGGILEDVEGILKVVPETGETTVFYSGMYGNLSKWLGKDGKYIYVKNNNAPNYSITKISIETGKLIKETVLNPSPDEYSTNIVSGSDGYFYYFGTQNSVHGLMRIDPDTGSVSLVKAIASMGATRIKTDVEKNYIYIYKAVWS